MSRIKCGSSGSLKKLKGLQRMCFCTMHPATACLQIMWQASSTNASGCQIVSSREMLLFCHMCNAFIYMTPAAMDKICSSLGIKSGQTAPRRKMSPPNRARPIDTEKEKKQRRPPPLKHFLSAFFGGVDNWLFWQRERRTRSVQRKRAFRRSRDCVPLFLF